MSAEILEDVVVTNFSIFHLQVCAHSEIPPAQVVRRANELHPTGISSSWSIDERADNPVRCTVDGEPTGRAHWLLSC